VSCGKRYFEKENGINFIHRAEVRHLPAYSNNSILKFGCNWVRWFDATMCNATMY